MTKKELKQRMLEYINRQSDFDKDEWYGTQRDFVESVLTEFARDEFGMDLDGDE